MKQGDVNRLRQLLDKYIDDVISEFGVASGFDNHPGGQAAERLAKHLGGGQDEDTSELDINDTTEAQL